MFANKLPDDELRRSIDDDTDKRHIDALRVLIAQAGLSQRALALKSGVSRGRINRLMNDHSSARLPINVVELNALTNAIGCDDICFAIYSAQSDEIDCSEINEQLHIRSLVSVMVNGLTEGLIEALRDMPECDDSNVRPEWGGALKKAIISKVCEASVQSTRRREEIYQKLFTI